MLLPLLPGQVEISHHLRRRGQIGPSTRKSTVLYKCAKIWKKMSSFLRKQKNCFSARAKIINTFLNLFMNEIGNSNKRNTYINFYIMCYYYRRNKIESPYSLLHYFSFLSYSKCCSAGIFRQKLDFEAMCE